MLYILCYYSLEYIAQTDPQILFLIDIQLVQLEP